MIKCRLFRHFSIIMITGFLFQSLGFTNPFGLFLPDPNRIKIKNQTPHQQAMRTRTAGMTKRMAPGTVSISGTVIDMNATLYSLNPSVSVIDTFGWNVAGATCDDAGRYTVSGLYPGAYLVMAYTDYQARNRGDGSGITYLGNTTNISGATWLQVTQGQALTGQNITIAAQQQKKVSISGTCYAGTGIAKPLAAAYLSLSFISADKPAGMLSMYNAAYGSARTGPDGAFSCTTAVAPGNYYVKIGISAYSIDTSYVSQWWDGSAITSEPTAAAIGSSMTGKEIHFEMGGRISGIVKDPSSAALTAGISINAIDKDGFILGQDYSSTVDTMFFMSGLPPGSYFIKVSCSTGDYLTTYYPQANSIDSATSITVSAGNVVQNIRISLRRNQNIPMGAKGAVNGKITRQDNNAAIPGIEVTFTTGSEPFYGGLTATTDSLGNFSDSLIADSSYYVYAGNGMGMSFGGSSDYYLSQTWYPGVTDMAAASKVKVTQGSPVTINLAALQGGSIAGWVRTASNTGFPSYLQGIYGAGDVAYGYAWTDDFKNIFTAFVQDLSGFRFCGVAPGSYTIRFISYSYDWKNQITGETDHAYATAKARAVTKENTAFSQVLTMPDGSARISGTVGPDPQRTQPTQFTALYCYAIDSILAGAAELSVLTGSVSQNSLRALFFSRDNTPSSAAPTQKDYSLGKLVPGKYAVARMELDTPSMAYYRQWYGTGTWEKLNVNPVSIFYRNFLKPTIPATTWITLSSSETKTGINFGNVGIVYPAHAQAVNADLCLLKSRSKNTVLRYRLPMLDKSNPAFLTIFHTNGARVRTIALHTPEGIVAWDGMNDKNAPVSAGVFVYRLSGAARAITVKGVLVR
jgi:hypothetical protein